MNRISLELTNQQNMRLSGDSRGTDQMVRQSLMYQQNIAGPEVHNTP